MFTFYIHGSGIFVDINSRSLNDSKPVQFSTNHIGTLFGTPQIQDRYNILKIRDISLQKIVPAGSLEDHPKFAKPFKRHDLKGFLFSDYTKNPLKSGVKGAKSGVDTVINIDSRFNS